MGYGYRGITLGKAIELKAIDEATQDLGHAVREADCIILCTPVGLFPELLCQMAPLVKPGAIVTDVGSTKRSVVDLAQKLLPETVHFVGSHPMAGSEKRGVEFARDDLFQGAVCITTPLPTTNAKALDAIEDLWRAVGMRIIRMTPAEHDRRVALVSHLPHAVAAALVALQDEESLALAGKGFADATRIAGGDGVLWRDIFVDNADELRAAVGKLRGQLDHLESLLRPESAALLKEWLDQISHKRQSLQ
jgi:prephenate dehydrogenase